MKRIFFLLTFLASYISSEAFPKVKLGAEVILDFGKKKLKDENGNCPGLGICTAKFHLTLDPSGMITPGYHGVAIDANGNVVIIVSKETLRANQPDKWNDFTTGSYSFINVEDDIPSDITSALNINSGRPIHLSGSYTVQEYSDCFVIVIGLYK